MSDPTAKASHPLRSAAFALAACLVVAVAALPLRSLLDLANIVMIFLLLVFLIALRFGRVGGVAAAVGSVVLFDYLFVPPHLGFIPTDAQYLVTLAVMLAVALVTAQRTAGLEEQRSRAASEEQRTRRLLRLARDLAGAASRREVQGALDAYLEESGLRAVLHLVDEPGELLSAQSELGRFLQEAISRGEALAIPSLGPALIVPLKAPERASGAMVVTCPSDPERLTQERDLLLSVVSLIAIAVERLHYVELAQEGKLQVASEKLRGTLLSALSHDLRTPLTVLVGMADALVVARRPLDPETRETAAAIRDQAREMGNLLGNLLDMARLQAGRVVLHKEWQLFDDLIGSSVRLLRLTDPGRTIRIRLAPDLPLVEFDAVLMERVIWNLLENSAKYSPPGSPIEIDARVEGGWASVCVCDRGPGFPPDRIDALFEMFVRGRCESAKPGVGLGLAICRTIVEVHCGTIEARNRPEGGACVMIRLPLGSPPAFEEDEPDLGMP